ncbi:hypothetical protein NEMIN01_0153 [Nematocida minor]|uniref:uncharacterized protein n=1 Tax=Nematocida minor TaxID=1912983 RepID=UPI00221FBCA7|nr:uncharacterized protein NEMIN01_0049 [Nematocida minor]XP_051332055.1 uncharacterized protein NEMIN01_0153 [Nematocida minor]KAI5188785.1 hypothetical protein NEMIN01_0049 [Nematocida minor]KAI5188889.1 hypothetical protein NEMIN01_0153 [Nematocida minor]
MNEKILNLHESVLEEYIKEIIPKFEERKHELIIMITNMPQKHSLVNCIAEELEKEYTREKIVELEIEALAYASKDFFLLTNALLYLERRWNTEVVKNLLQRASKTEEQFSVLFSFLTDPNEEDVEGECDLSPNITIPEDFTEIQKVYEILHSLRDKNIISSIRDSFTAYKIITAYGPNVVMVTEELNILAQLESVAFNDLLGGVLLGVLYEKSQIPHFSNILVRLLRRNKIYIQSVIQLFITAYNIKDNIWESIQEMIPHLYVRLGIDRKMAFCLLYTLNLKNAIFLFELFNGEVPQIDVFDRCVQGRESIPDEEVRRCVRASLSIPDGETYTAEDPFLDTLPGQFTYKPSTKYAEVEDKMYFYSFFMYRTNPSITHVNNVSLEYKDVIKNLTEEEMDTFVRIVLSARNSLVHKELTVNRLYTMRTR